MSREGHEGMLTGSFSSCRAGAQHCAMAFVCSGLHDWRSSSSFCPARGKEQIRAARVRNCVSCCVCLAWKEERSSQGEA